MSLRWASPVAYSMGTTISFARTMFRRLRAAISMACGSVRNRSISTRRVWFALRNPSTSVCIRTYCWDAKAILVRVRTVTATHIANVPNMIIPKITQAGMTPPRCRTSAGVPIMSLEISLTDVNGEYARGTTRCARIRSSTQYVFMTLLTKHLQVLRWFWFHLNMNCWAARQWRLPHQSSGCAPWPPSLQANTQRCHFSPNGDLWSRIPLTVCRCWQSGFHWSILRCCCNPKEFGDLAGRDLLRGGRSDQEVYLR